MFATDVEKVLLKLLMSTMLTTCAGDVKLLKNTITEIKVRIPVWYHRKEDYYDILLDDIMHSARLGCLQINKKGLRYVKVPIGDIVAVDEDRLSLIDDPSKEVILNE